MSNKNEDYEQGETDCHSGIPAREGMSDNYYEGYGLVYECDARHSNMMNDFEQAWAAVV